MTFSTLQYSGMPPSRMAMGCEPLGGIDWGIFDIKLARRAVKTAWDNGITTFDTADVYGLGQGEEELSKALGKRKHEAFIITKFGVRWHKNSLGGRAKTYKDASPSYLVTALEDSLSRLKVDAISLYLVHWPDKNTNIEDTLFALEKIRQEGKILNYGLSNFDPETIDTVANLYPISAIEGPYSLIDRNRGGPMFEMARKHSITCFAYGPFAQGLLTGKFTRQTVFSPNDRRSRLPHFSKKKWEHNMTILNTLKELSHSYQKTPAQIAIRWVLDSGNIDIVIAGAKSPIQVKDNANSLYFKLSPEDVQKLNKVSETM
jgi:myo-inositol catabolism protein IolS